jgi:uncharacterized protein (DUF927 family)
MTREYPPDFGDWTPEARDAFFGEKARDYRDAKKTNGNGADHSHEQGQSPSPGHISWGDFKMDRKGLTQETKKTRGDDVAVEKTWISAPFEILGACRDPQGSSWGKFLRWLDDDRRVHQRHISDAALQGDAGALCAALACDGLKINRDKQRAFATYLSGAFVRERVTLVSRTGWHEVNGHQIFVLGTETIGPIGSERVILDVAAVGKYESRGTLKDWQDGVGSLCAAHFLPVLAVSAALAGPLLDCARQEGGGVHIHGGSSKGKTTILQAGASVWGKGGTPGYVRTWRATANGLEGAASSATDTILVLDELGVLESREAGAAIYSLANGGGKNRANRDGSLREPKSWRLLTLSTGEVPLEAKLAEDKRKARAGQLVRMLDISADRGCGFGVFDSGGPDGDAAQISKAIKDSAQTAYGTAGPEFVRKIVEHGLDEIAETVRTFLAEFVGAEVPAKSDGQIDRAAHRLGLIAAAGELATLLEITPWESGTARNAAAWALTQWVEGRGGGEPAEVRQAIEQVRLFIEMHGDSRFERIGDADARPVNNRAGWRKGDGTERIWMVPPEVWKAELCAGLNPTMGARTLADRGMLRRGTDQLAAVAKIDGKPTRVFTLTEAILAGEGTGNDT